MPAMVGFGSLRGMEDRWRVASLPVLEARVWESLGDAVARPDAAWRTPVVASVGSGPRAVDARVMVLRAVSRARGTLTCFTDARSPKLDAVRSTPFLAWTFYDPGERVQLRVGTTVEIHVDDAVSREAWALVPEPGRKNYATRLAPGSCIPGPLAGHDFTVALAEHFAVLAGTVTEIDWLWMAADGHRRARFRYDAGGVPAVAEWLVP